ncbi:F-box protein SKIP22-like [Mercurialis annua]|uniref:F-box protein SKIP22-like n=1 Tax=Mercurialis annua TaxID=3986 RepID=UPI00215E6F6F|nr:F-box protein SKIP22-like [Mercurialis annua]
MKLRLRSLPSKETIKLELPNESNLQQLKETLILAISSSSSPNSLHFSLNGKHELSSTSNQDSLKSLGITSGDLIYFTRNPSEFAPIQQTQEANFQNSVKETENSQELKGGALNGSLIQDSSVEEICKGKSVMGCEENYQEMKGLESNPPKKESLFQDSCVNVICKGKSVMGCEGIENQEPENVDHMDVDKDEKGFTEPCFLKRVLRYEEFGDDFSDSKLLFIAIHAVFLESGFIGFDSVLGLRVDLFHILQEQPLMNFTTSVCYTVPELLGNDNVTDFVVLKFQTLGQFVNVYGSLSMSQSSVYKSCLDKCRFVPVIGSIWGNWDKSDRDYESDSYNENIVFELWKTVKDQLALPLLIDLCEKTGLDLPPCLMFLPADIKLKILEYVPGVDVAKVTCVCKEMQYLCSNNDLWKKRYEEEFRCEPRQPPTTHWKKKFVSAWERMKRGSLSYTMLHPPFMAPQPFGGGIAGGDYDRLPGFGFPFAYGRRTQIYQPPGNLSRMMRERDVIRRYMAPNYLGGFNA